jgi:hypothetical protein
MNDIRQAYDGEFKDVALDVGREDLLFPGHRHHIEDGLDGVRALLVLADAYDLAGDLPRWNWDCYPSQKGNALGGRASRQKLLTEVIRIIIDHELRQLQFDLRGV